MSGLLLTGAVSTIDTNVDAIKSDTDAYLDASVSSRASAAALTTVDTVVDAIKSTVDTNLDATVTSRLSGQTVQTGWRHDTVFSTSGTDEDYSYVDVTISAVGAVADCYCYVQGAVEDSPAASFTAAVMTARLTSTTNLRLSCYLPSLAWWKVRWYVVEIN